MRRDKRAGARGKPAGGEKKPAQSPQERAEALIARLEARESHLVTAAEELDRLQGTLERLGSLEGLRERVAELCDAWSEATLRGDTGQAWLTLVGAFDLKEHALRVASLAEEMGAPVALRAQACRVLARLGGDAAVLSLGRILASRSDAQIRVAAAEGLASLRDPSVRPLLESLLEEDLPRNVWSAVSETLDRLPRG